MTETGLLYRSPPFCLSPQSLEPLKETDIPLIGPQALKSFLTFPLFSPWCLSSKSSTSVLTSNRTRSRLAHVLLEDSRMHNVLIQRHGWMVGYLKMETVKLKPQGAKKSPIIPNSPPSNKKTKPYPRSASCCWQGSRARLSPSGPGIPCELPTRTLRAAFPNSTH